MSISTQIKHFRKEKGLTQEQLANAVGVSVMTIRRFEAGTREPKTPMLTKIAKALEVPKMRFYEITEEDKQIEEKMLAEIHSGKFGIIPDYLHLGSDLNCIKLLHAFDKLNQSGKETAVQRVEELTEMERYTKTEQQD